MEVYKKVDVFWTLVPETIIETEDVFQKFLILTLKLASIQPINPKFLSAKFGFTSEISKYLIQRLLANGYLNYESGDNQLILSSYGRTAIREKKIFVHKSVTAKLLIMVNPKYIIANHWNRNIVLPKIEDDYSKFPSTVIQIGHIGLHDSFLSFGSELHVVDQQNAIIELEIATNTQYNYRVKISSISLGEREIQIDEENLEFRDIHNKIVENLTPDRIADITYSGIAKYLSPFNLDFELDFIKEELYEINLDSTTNLTLNDKIGFINFLSKKKWNLDPISFEISIYNDWYIEVEAKILSKNKEILEIMFITHITHYKGIERQLIRSKSFKADLVTLWKEFLEDYDIDFELDLEGIFEILWNLEQPSKIYASRLIEEDVISIGS